MYYSHFGLSQPPFKITPDTDFFYSGGNRGAILDALVYAITSGEGIVKVVGEVGSGKTMLCRMLETRLPAGVEIIYLANPSLSRDEILYAIADELGLNLGGQRITVVIRALQAHLIRKYAQGQQVVVFIDEAQAMPLDSLEEIRLLSNLETGTHKLLQMVMFGQPELDHNLGQPQMRQLRERITHGFNLAPFVKPDIQDYLMFRLRAAGYHGPDLFSGGAIRLIAQASQGLIRRINILADKTLLAAFAQNTHTIREKHVRAAIRDCEFGNAPGGRRKLAIAAALVALGLALGAGWHKLAAGSPESAGQSSAPPQPRAVTVEAGPAVEHDQLASAPETTAADPLQQRLKETRAWLASGKDTHFAIQLMLVDASASAQLARDLNKLDQELGLHRVYVYPTVANGRKGMNVMFGTFSSYQEAKDALATLPPTYQASRPLLRTLKGIKDEIQPREAK